MNNLYEEMNNFLADQLVLGMKIHNVHWYIKGYNFFTIHVKMDEFYGATQTRIDEVAERLLSIGGAPIGSLKEALERTSIKELADKAINDEALVEVLYTDFAQARTHAIRLIELADKAKDYGTADYFTGVLREYEKDLWMLGAFLRKA